MTKRANAIYDKVDNLINAFSSKANPCIQIAITSDEFQTLLADREDLNGNPVNESMPLVYRDVILYPITEKDK